MLWRMSSLVKFSPRPMSLCIMQCKQHFFNWLVGSPPPCLPILMSALNFLQLSRVTHSFLCLFCTGFLTILFFFTFCSFSCKLCQEKKKNKPDYQQVFCQLPVKPILMTPDNQVFILVSTQEFWASYLRVVLYTTEIAVVSCLGRL